MAVTVVFYGSMEVGRKVLDVGEAKEMNHDLLNEIWRKVPSNFELGIPSDFIFGSYKAFKAEACSYFLLRGIKVHHYFRNEIPNSVFKILVKKARLMSKLAKENGITEFPGPPDEDDDDDEIDLGGDAKEGGTD